MAPKIVFLGNTKYSVIGADIINKAYPISLVITKPSTPPVEWSKKNKIPCLETTLLDRNLIKKIAMLKPDFLIVEDFGLILPTELLRIPKLDALNIHHSLLPKYRGPAPAPYAILAGDETSGVTIISMVEEVDAGDILAQQKYTISLEETTDSLLTKLNELGGKLMINVLSDYLKGEVQKTKQSLSNVVLTKRLTKEDGYFEIGTPPESDLLDKMVRAYHPWPGVWTRWNGKIVKFYPKGLVQMEGKKAMPLENFLNGYPDFPIKQLH